MKIIILLLLSIYTFAFELVKPVRYEKSKDYTNWVMSEKLDGIRAYWDGKELLTRKGNKIHAPKWFIDSLPTFKLDGELWTKRADFENIQNIVMDKKPSNKWQEITYNIFEVPNQSGDLFKRLEKVNKYIKQNPNKHLKVIKQIKIKNNLHLEKILKKLISKKAEGLIIRDPNKAYHTRRSKYMAKVKSFQDMEGIVIGIKESNKLEGFKSLKLRLENGVVFNLGGGFTLKQRKNYPKIGEVVTFKYYGFTKKGKPKFASFLHYRKD